MPSLLPDLERRRGGNISLDCGGTEEYFLSDGYSCIIRKPTNLTPNLLDWSWKMNLRKVPTRSFQRNFHSLASPFLINGSGLNWSVKAHYPQNDPSAAFSLSD
jgi:hypothetical protein